LNTGLKLASFFLRKLTILVVVLLLIVLATFFAYDAANIYVMAKDGLSQRADTIINGEDADSLNRFFTKKFLNSDSLLRSNPYEGYQITDYGYELKIRRIWVWPWQSRTNVLVEESIPESSWKFSITDEMREKLTEEQGIPQDAEKEDGPNAKNGETTKEAAEAPSKGAKKVKLNIPKPKWQNGKKTVEFRKVKGQWKINRIALSNSPGSKQDTKKDSGES